MDDWLNTIPLLDRFAQVADPDCYAQVPDDWWIGISDVVDSTVAIENGRYKAVNLAGAGTISAVSNAIRSELDGQLRLFAFGGDGAHFVVPPDHRPSAATALARVAMWARSDLGLDLRVGMVRIGDARVAGFDTRVAYWRASDNVHYAMFMGGGLGWADTQLKSGAIGLPPAQEGDWPDLSGLSCQWGEVRSHEGTILSLIVKPAKDAPQSRFTEIAHRIIEVLEEGPSANPVPTEGPRVRWPAGSIDLQSRISRQQQALWWRRLRVTAGAAFAWLIFKFGIRVGGFEPDRYRREITENTDFRKFDDGLLMTVDCSPDTAAELRNILETAAAEGVVRYGMHTQDEALMTCVVPSVLTSDHMHFVDGAGGGYATAARQLDEARSALANSA